jgi:predicted Zn-dependent peptidase
MTRGRLLLRLENSHSVASWLGGQEILIGKILTVDEVLTQVEELKDDDLFKIAEKLFDSNRLCLAVVGPNDERELLEQLLYL